MKEVIIRNITSKTFWVSVSGMVYFGLQGNYEMVWGLAGLATMRDTLVSKVHVAMGKLAVMK